MLKKYFKKYEGHFHAIFRVIVGLFFLFHGLQKFGFIGEGSIGGFAGVMGLPFFVAWLVALAELVGGIAILLGFFTRLAALLGGIVMIGAYFIAHFPNPVTNGGELAFIYLAAFLVLLAKGSGMWSLEKMIFKKEFF